MNMNKVRSSLWSISLHQLHSIGSNSSEDESSNDRDSKRRRTRTNFTSTQIDELEKAFQEGKLRDLFDIHWRGRISM